MGLRDDKLKSNVYMKNFYEIVFWYQKQSNSSKISLYIISVLYIYNK